MKERRERKKGREAGTGRDRRKEERGRKEGREGGTDRERRKEGRKEGDRE